MDESMQEYRTLLTDNPAKADKQLYKLAKKGDLNALSALNVYRHLHGIRKRLSCREMRRRNALWGCVISTGTEQKSIMKKRAVFMSCPQSRGSGLPIIGWGFYMNRDLAWQRISGSQNSISGRRYIGDVGKRR